MKLKFKSLQGSSFAVEADPSETIASVKSKIEGEHGHLASSQKIIYSGKILTDADTVQSCGVSEKDFLVLMVSKPKAAKAVPAATAPTSAATTQTPAPSTATATNSAADSAPAATEATSTPASAATEAPTTTAPASAAPDAAPSGGQGTSQFLVGSALEGAVNNIVDMGFEKSEVQKAMRASFNNPERAVEYLMTGIPEHLSQPPQQSAPPPPQGQASQPAGGGEERSGAAPAASAPSAAPAAPAPAAAAAANPRAGNLFEAAAAAQAHGGGAQGGGGAGGALSSLEGMEDDGNGRSVLDLGNPAMVAQLRQLVQQNPAALNPLVQALAQSNPRLAHAMAEDPEGVLNLLASGAAGGEGEGEEGLTLPAMDELNPEDRTAVEQIIAMGIPETKAIEAYLMCGRNVEMAVQYYFENPQDFDD